MHFYFNLASLFPAPSTKTSQPNAYRSVFSPACPAPHYCAFSMNQSAKCAASANTEGAMSVLQSKPHELMPQSTPPSQIRGLPVSLRRKDTQSVFYRC